MAVERLSRRAFVARGAAAGAVFTLAACGGSAGSTSASLTRSRARKPGGRATLGDLRRTVRGRVVTADSSDYGAAAEVYNLRYEGARPLAIVQPQDSADVSAAVRWADRRDARVLAKSGGHSYAGYSTGDDVLVVDLSTLASVRLDRGAGTVDIQPGAQLIDVYTKLAAQGLTVPAGSCPSVGAGGHFLGGGFGFAGRKLGLASDNVRGVQVVTADGKVITAKKHHHEDLLWACRGGGGGNFGVTTNFKLKVHPVSPVSYFRVTFPWAQASAAMNAWQGLIPGATHNVTSGFVLTKGASIPAAVTSGQYFGSESDLPNLLAPLTAVSGATLQTGTMDYGAMMLYWAGCASLTEGQCHTVGTTPDGTFPRKRFLAKSDYVSAPLHSAGRDALIQGLEASNTDALNTVSILLDSYGGALNKPAPDDTAFVHRDALYSIQYITYFPESDTHAAEQWAKTTWNSMRPHVSGAAYQNYIDPRLDGWEKAYYGKNYARLRHVKKRYDPDFRFRFAQAIRPA